MDKNDILAWLKKTGTPSGREAMARYGIEAKTAHGVPMGALLKLSKELGKDHALSLALWETGCYEARLLAALIGEPEKVTRAQLSAWGRSFENWGDGDTACFKLLDRSPLAWDVIEPWTASPREFTKRGGFALIACLALHDKKSSDDRFLALLPLIDAGASDERHFVKKGVNWALRSIGERGPMVRAAVIELAGRLSNADGPAARWIGRDALKQLAIRAENVRTSKRMRPAEKARSAAKKRTATPRKI